MKRITILLWFFFGFYLVVEAQDFRKFAVVVGVAKHQNPNLDLKFSDDDAYRFYAYLKSCEGGAVPDEHIAVLVDEAANKQNIINTMHAVYSKASPNDMLIFYFSGHGTEGGFCPTDVTDQFNSLLQHTEIKEIFKKYPARFKIVFADACFSGSIYQGAPAKTNNPPKPSNTTVVLMMSSLYTETSQENPKLRQGIFTYYLLKGLKGSADRNKDKTVTLDELFVYVKANVMNFTENKQTPFIEGNASRSMPLSFVRQ